MSITPTFTNRTNYIGKTAAELGLTQNLESSGAFNQTVIGIGDKYMIDIYGNMMTYRAEDTPLLTILANLGTTAEKGPYIMWSDEYDGDMWWDIAIDHLRYRDNAGRTDTDCGPLSGSGARVAVGSLPHQITASQYVGGQLRPLSVTALTTTAANNLLTCAAGSSTLEDITFTGTAVNQVMGQCFVPSNNRGATSLANHVFIAFRQDNNNTVGTIENVYNRVHQLLLNLRYQHITNITGPSGRSAERFDYVSTAYAPVYMSFDELAFAVGSIAAANGALTKTVTVNHQIMALITKAGRYTNASGVYIFFELDFGRSNLNLVTPLRNWVTYVATTTTGICDSICISTPIIHSGTVADHSPYELFLNEARTTAGYHPKMSRMLFIGRNLEAAVPLPEGDTFGSGGNFTSYRERITNCSQIFATPRYGITGTHQASTFRFGDDFQRTRAKWLSIYKGRKESSFLFGVKGETIATSTEDASQSAFITGQPVRSVGGLLDYALFPINYMRLPLPVMDPDAAFMIPVSGLISWMDNLADRLATPKNSTAAQAFVFLCSRNFLRRLTPWTRVFTANANMMGGQVQLAKPSTLTFGLEVYSFESSAGHTLRFIHEPSLDVMPTFPVPFWLFGTGSLNPRDVLISIDTNNIKQVITRPDRIYGNIQLPGQDAFLEGMRGEASFMLRYPRNHAIIFAPTVA